MNYRVALVACLLFVSSCLIFYNRLISQDPELLPGRSTGEWHVQAQVQIPASERRINFTFAIPPESASTKLQQETFRSSGLAAALLQSPGRRQVIWSGYNKSKEPLILAYAATLREGTGRVTPMEELIERKSRLAKLVSKKELEQARKLIKNSRKLNPEARVEKLRACIALGKCNSVDPFRRIRSSERRLALVFAEVLREANIPAVTALGFPARADYEASVVYWVRAKAGTHWSDYTASISAERLLDPGRILWHFVPPGAKLTSSENEYEITITVKPASSASLVGLPKAKEFESIAWQLASTKNVPLSLQAVLSLLLLLPVGALVICFYRVILGIQTLGTFMPVLLAISFRETGLAWGLILVSALAVFGFVARASFRNLQLLFVPRLSATLTIVIIFLFFVTRLSQEFNFARGLTISLFPIVIITMMIERVAISWEESGGWKTLWLYLSTLVATTLAYSVISNKVVQHWTFSFPELQLFVLGLIIIIGRYTGFRLSELFRFRSLFFSK